jgi:uncharacterized protein HemX
MPLRSACKKVVVASVDVSDVPTIALIAITLFLGLPTSVLAWQAWRREAAAEKAQRTSEHNQELLTYLREQLAEVNRQVKPSNGKPLSVNLEGRLTQLAKDVQEIKRAHHTLAKTLQEHQNNADIVVDEMRKQFGLKLPKDNE